MTAIIMGRLLGIDYGKERTGIAVTDELRMISSPFDVFQSSQNEPKLKELHRNYHFDAAVIGDPVSDIHPEMMEIVRKFGKKVQEWLEIPVYYQDETNSSLWAEALLKQMPKKKSKKEKKQIDKYAAQKILEDFLKSDHYEILQD